MVKIEYYGHAYFLITISGRFRVAMDPYNPSAVDYPVPNVKADVVTVSHDHADHNYVEAVSGNPIVMREVGEKDIQGVSFKGIGTYHDNSDGRLMGPNIIWVINDGKLSVVHTGDLGHILTFKQIEEIGKVDVLLLTIGGIWNIGPQEATRVMDMLRAKVVIPMHFYTPFSPSGVASLHEFLKGKGTENIAKGVRGNSVEIDEKKLPERTLITNLPYNFKPFAENRTVK